MREARAGATRVTGRLTGASSRFQRDGLQPLGITTIIMHITGWVP